MDAAVAIRSARRSAGLSLRELASASGVPPARISDYERGRHDPSTAMLARLLDAAGFDLVSRERAGGRDRIDLRHNARAFADVLTLADAIPARRQRRPAPPTWAHITDRSS